MNIIMYPHSGCHNHGCEAIVRSTSDILGMKKENVFLYTSDIGSDRACGLNEVCTLLPNLSADIRSGYIRKKTYSVKARVFSKDRECEEICHRHKNILRHKKNMVALSIGGDNYCYPGMQHILNEYMRMFVYKGIPTVLWACSLERTLISPKVADELKQYDVITARESITAETLMDIGCKNQVLLCADPAFILPKKPVSFKEEIFAAHEVIGINVSGMMLYFEAYPKATVRNFTRLIEHILKNTDCYIALIPHVLAETHNDLELMRSMLQDIQNERVFCVDADLNSSQYKSIISRCMAFIGCRTHATIAAYSSCVPTLTVGYSTKSKGIAKDLFGDDFSLVLDGRRFADDMDLTRGFQAFWERRHSLGTHLQQIMPGYMQRAYVGLQGIEICKARL